MPKLTDKLTLIVAPFIVGLLVLGCGGDDPPSSNPAPSGASGTIATVPPGGGAVATLPASAPTVPAGNIATTAAGSATTVASAVSGLGSTSQAFANVRSYQVDITTAVQGQNIQMMVQVQNPDRYKATISGGPIPIEVIAIGTQTYLKLGPAWQVAPATSLPVQPNVLIAQVRDYLNLPGAMRGAMATVGGASCQIWTVATPQNQRVEICVSTDGLPRQVKYNDVASTVTIIYTNFNQAFNIVPPI